MGRGELPTITDEVFFQMCEINNLKHIHQCVVKKQITKKKKHFARKSSYCEDERGGVERAERERERERERESVPRKRKEEIRSLEESLVDFFQAWCNTLGHRCSLAGRHWFVAILATLHRCELDVNSVARFARLWKGEESGSERNPRLNLSDHFMAVPDWVVYNSDQEDIMGSYLKSSLSMVV